MTEKFDDEAPTIGWEAIHNASVPYLHFSLQAGWHQTNSIKGSQLGGNFSIGLPDFG
jgi:hypothetical protein